MNLKVIVMFAVMLVACFTFCGYREALVADKVILTIIKQDDSKILLKMRNDRATPIFLGYQRGKETRLSIVAYRLVCFQGKVEADFGPDWHGSMGLDPVEPGDELEFETLPVPKLQNNCYISVAYYSNAKAVEIVKKAATNPYVNLTNEENEFLKRSTEKVIVKLRTKV